MMNDDYPVCHIARTSLHSTVDFSESLRIAGRLTIYTQFPYECVLSRFMRCVILNASFSSRLHIM